MNVSSVFDSFVGCLRSVFYKLQPGAAEEPPAASQLTTPTFSPTLPLLGELSGGFLLVGSVRSHGSHRSLRSHGSLFSQETHET